MCIYSLKQFLTKNSSKKHVMKKSMLLFICLAIVVHYSIAQKATFGITAGAVFSSLKQKVGSLSVTSDIKPGFTMGFAASVPLGTSFSFMPALNYIQKGGTVKEDEFEDKLTFNYIEMPLNFVYNANAGKGKFFVGAGPSLSFGISGKDKWEDGSESGDDDIKFGSGEEDDLKPFEFGANFLTGYRFNSGFQVSANYNLGLSNIANTEGVEAGDYSSHNRYFGISVGYFFQGKKKS
jgi:hypothetical protein